MSRLEVHRHAIISGPRANKSWCNEIVHSHEGGDQPHEHENTGPASRTIDKDEWYARTGLRGGGRKKFTAKPTGEQFATIPTAPLTYEIILVGKPVTTGATGPGLSIVHRLDLACDAKPRSVRRAG